MNDVINDKKDKKRSDEYVALRAELLSLHARAHDVWRWGLISIFAVLGVVVTTLINIRNDMPYFMLFVVTVMLYVLAAGIALTLADLSADIQEAMHRVGGYLAVFHDLGSAKSAGLAYTLGWHVWNRIERTVEQPPGLWLRFWCHIMERLRNIITDLRRSLQLSFWKRIIDMVKTCKLPTMESPTTEPRMRRFTYHGDPIVYVWVLGLFVFCVSALMSGATAKACFTVGFFVLLVLVGIPPVIAVWSYLRVINRELREGLEKWNGRWVELLELDDSEINKRLHAASLHLGNDKGPIQNDGTA